eukprot:308887_1
MSTVTVLFLIDRIITSIDVYLNQSCHAVDQRDDSLLRLWMTKNTGDVNKMKSALNRTKTRKSKPFTTDITRLLQEVVLFPAEKTLKPISHTYDTIPRAHAPKPDTQTITIDVLHSNDDAKQNNNIGADKKTQYKPKTIRPVSFDYTVDVPPDICKAFWTNGAVCLRNVFDKKLLNEIRDKFDEILNDSNHICTKWCEEYTPYGTEKIKSGRFVGINDTSRRISPFEKLVFESPAACIAGNILASSRIAFLFDHVFYKACKTTTATLWHRGQPDWCVAGEQLCSIWIPFDFVPKETCLELVAGSHRWGEIIPDIDTARDKHTILSWDMRCGDCIVFHGMTVHGAPANHLKTQPRHAMVMRFLGDDIRYDTSRLQVYPWYNFGATQRHSYTPKELKHGDYICSKNCDEIPVIWGDSTQIEQLKKEEYIRFSEEQKKLRKVVRRLDRDDEKEEDGSYNDEEVVNARLGKEEMDRYCCYAQLLEKAKMDQNETKIMEYKNKMKQILESGNGD